MPIDTMTKVWSLPRTIAAIAAAAALAGCGSLREFSEENQGAESLFDVDLDEVAGEDAFELATDPFDADNRTRGLERISRSNDGDSRPALDLYEAATADEDASVRRAAALGLAEHGLPRHVPAIIPLLGDDDPTVRAAAARALQFIHGDGAADALIDRLDPADEDSPLVRTAAAEALGQYPEPAVVQALIDALDERDLAVNDAASRSLETLTGQQFGLDLRSWVTWFDATGFDASGTGAGGMFLAGRAYEHPGYSRGRMWYEYALFWRSIPSREPDLPRGSPFGQADTPRG